MKWISPPGMKYCSMCSEHLPLESFPKASRSHDGRFTWCTPCTRQRNRARTPEQKRNWALRSKYGITLQQYEEMLEAQGSRCAICQTKESNPDRKLAPFAVDHCHATGKVRSLLCSNCNFMLGAARDDVSTLTAAIRYLTEHTRSQPD